ncbi:MAG: ribonuclease R family protein [Phycisphaerales bacterium]
MPLRYRQRILDHLGSDGYKPALPDDLLRDMRIPEDDTELFQSALDQLVERESVQQDQRGRIQLPKAGDELTGSIKVTARGFGFVTPDILVREGDIFIPPPNLADAVSGDRVRIRLERRKMDRGGGGGRGAGSGGGGRGRESRVGRVLEVVERGRSNYVGTLFNQRGQWLVQPDGVTLRDPVIIRDPYARNAREGDKVVIEIVEYPDGGALAEGVITNVLGQAGIPSVETQAVITAHGLRDAFPDGVVEEARGIVKQYQQQIDDGTAYADRDDLRETFTITIDPPDAKDFDDAISIEHNAKDDTWVLGVHIADVAHFVRTGSELDAEARARGNSVYLPRLVLPMLPEVLSNGICSLQEGVPRLTKSAFISYDSRGKVIAQRACSSVIESSKRLTYLEAQALIDGNEGEARKHTRAEPDYSPQLIETLKLCDRLAKILRERRRRDGMISLNLPEVELKYGEEGHVIGVEPEDDAFTHTLIEMFMVEANEAVARLFDGLNIPIIRRIHPDPAISRMDMLQTYALVAGVHIPNNPSRRDLQQLLEKTRSSPAARAIHFAVLRTLTKAAYSPALIGHYALASEHYTHFTSPIRRYPDLTIHRALEAYLERTDNGHKVPGGRKRTPFINSLIEDDRILDEDQLIQLGRHCSETEDAAEEAERELREYLVLQFLVENHLGDVFPAVVTGVSNGGAFVSIEQFLIEGMVKADALDALGQRRDRWRIDERSGRLTAQQSGATIGMGDSAEVEIVKIDLATRQMDLIFTRLPQQRRHVPEPRSGQQRRGPSRDRSSHGSRGQKPQDNRKARSGPRKEKGSSRKKR